MTILRGHVRIQLPNDDPDRALQRVTEAPDGADVTINVPAGTWPPVYGIQWIADHGGHLQSITIESSDPSTIRNWLAHLQAAQARLTDRPAAADWTRWLDWTPGQKENVAA